MIKHFIKVFFASIVLISTILSVTALGYIVFIDKNIVIKTIKTVDVQETKKLEFYESSTFDYNTEIGKKAKASKRFNVLVVGLENHRTDTIMLASYDMENKTANLISIPRDTYYPRDVYDSPDLKKINSIYAKEGIDALVASIQELLGIPIEKYVIIDYKAVISAVDLLDGIEVDVPFHMMYSDPYDDPPLIIDIPEGRQILNGEQALKFLRYRKGYANQDLGRIEQQQKFVKLAIKKALGIKLPSLIKEVYSYTKTNIKLSDILFLADDIIGFSVDNISLSTLPGTETILEGLSFYIPEEDKIKDMISSMYNILESN